MECNDPTQPADSRESPLKASGHTVQYLTEYVEAMWAAISASESRASAAYLEEMKSARGRPDFTDRVTAAGIRYVVAHFNATADNSLPDGPLTPRQLNEYCSLLKLLSEHLKNDLVPRLAELEPTEFAKRRFQVYAVLELTERMNQLHADASIRLQKKQKRMNSESLKIANAIHEVEAALASGKRKHAVQVWQQVRQNMGKKYAKARLYEQACQDASDYYKWERGEHKVGSRPDVDITKALLEP